MAKLGFYGAAGEVTGSCYVVESDRARVMIDCGMHQGELVADEHNRRLPPIDLDELDAILLTHAHLDHCGRLPLLVKNGYKGPIFCTPATREVAAIILRDAAFLQEEDCARFNRRLRQGQEPCEEPLYTAADAELTIRQFRSMNYNTPTSIANGVEVELFDAGHILGAASARMTIEGAERSHTIVFSGDVGVRGSPILRDPVTPDAGASGRHIDAVLLESTYGDRDHRSLEETRAQFLAILRDAQEKGSRVLIPAFALGRTQDIVYHIGEFIRTGALKAMPVFVDSPMASSVSQLYTRHVGLYDERAKELLKQNMKPLAFEGLRYTASVDESKSLNDRAGPIVIIAASGMCTGGRILHHLVRGLPDERTHVVFVGFQGDGTLGRRLVDGASSVRIFREDVAVKARIHTLGGFSAHAGQTGLIEWVTPLIAARKGEAAPKVYLTHGEDGPRAALAGKIGQRFKIAASMPKYGDEATM